MTPIRRVLHRFRPYLHGQLPLLLASLAALLGMLMNAPPLPRADDEDLPAELTTAPAYTEAPIETAEPAENP